MNRIKLAVAAEEVSPAQPTHKHHKATMPEASHGQYVESQENRGQPKKDPEPDAKKSHKHYKANMSGEEHNPK